MQETRIYTLNQYLRDCFGEKIYRLSLNPGTGCPNRDGTVGTGGCTFCSAGGSGEFAAEAALSIPEQLLKAKEKVAHKGAKRYLAYFQAFTGTYAPLPYLETIFRQALAPEDIVGLSIATRPDCLPSEVLQLLTQLKAAYHKPIWIELGLQTADDTIAEAFHRGYPYTVFADTVSRLHAADIPIIVHLILGLPYETPASMLHTVETVCALPISGLKLSQLHILKHTQMALLYEQHPEAFALMDKEAYVDTLLDLIEHIPKNIVLHRITGDGDKRLLIAPQYTADKRGMLNFISRRMQERDCMQGRLARIPKEDFYAT